MSVWTLHPDRSESFISSTMMSIFDEPSLDCFDRMAAMPTPTLPLRSFSTPRFLNAPACVVLDLQMPDLTGLEVQELLANRKTSLPIVFISGHGNIPSSVQAMKAGAVDFLTKPFDEEQLIIAIDAALERARESQQRDNSFAKDRDAFERLSQRERQVCVCVAEGMLNKQIAAKFGTKEKTVKVQRGNLIKKLGAHSAADIVLLVERLRSAGYFAEQAPESKPDFV